MHRNAKCVNPKDATYLDAFRFRYDLAGSQHMDLVWRDTIIEVETSTEAKHNDACSGRFTHYVHARTCYRDVTLVFVAPRRALVRRFDAK